MWVVQRGTQYRKTAQISAKNRKTAQISAEIREPSIIFCQNREFLAHSETTSYMVYDEIVLRKIGILPKFF